MAKSIAVTKGSVDVVVTVSGFDPIVVAFGKLAKDIQHAAMVHGLAQKLGDAAAMSRNSANGQPASNAEKYKAVKAVADNLLAGKWNLSAGGVSNHAVTPERIAVLAVMFKKDEAAVASWAKGRTEAQLAAAFTSAAFALELAKYRAKHATAPADDVFEGLSK